MPKSTVYSQISYYCTVATSRRQLVIKLVFKYHTLYNKPIFLSFKLYSNGFLKKLSSLFLLRWVAAMQSIAQGTHRFNSPRSTSVGVLRSWGMKLNKYINTPRAEKKKFNYINVMKFFFNARLSRFYFTYIIFARLFMRHKIF